MDRDLALMVLRTVHASERELASLVPLLKANCDENEYEQTSFAIATLLHELEATICRPIYEQHPDVAAEIEARVDRFGRML